MELPSNATEAMFIAFDSAISKLRTEDQQNEVIQLIAERIIELARTGERNPDRLCEYAIIIVGCGAKSASSQYTDDAKA
jgi:hypothetical protein